MQDIVCISPIDGREVARRQPVTAEQLQRALQRARAAQLEWSRVSIAERVRYMLALLDALLAMTEGAVPELALQMGRPVRFGGEFGGVEERIRYMAAIAEDALQAQQAPDSQPGFRRLIKREPLGLVLVVAPWNYPYLTAVNTIVPALIAGNAVLLKHAAQTLLVGERFDEAMRQAGLPAGLFTNLVLSHEQTAELLASAAIDHVNFTGSVAAGRAIEQAAAGTFTTLGLELGGKDPAYVREDADFDRTVANLVDGAFYNAGQCCCAVERIYVHASLYPRFLDAFSAQVRDYVLGNPLDAATTLGPMAHMRFAQWVRRQTREALAQGALAHIDPGSFPADRDNSPYLAPQVLSNVNHAMSVMMEESFGPVVGIMPVKSDTEAIALMNDSPYGLTASIWTADTDAAERIGDTLQTGTVFMNRCDYLDPALAWTGVKDTGRGVSLSPIGFQQLTQPKSFHLRREL